MVVRDNRACSSLVLSAQQTTLPRMNFFQVIQAG
jgi:hypothetical protein